MNEGLVYEILSVVAEIPEGRVCSYGEIARQLAEKQGLARMSAQAVGGAVGHNPISLMIPCHRVVTRAGRTAPHWPEQQTLLEAEGVAFRANGTVDMARFLWRGE